MAKEVNIGRLLGLNNRQPLARMNQATDAGAGAWLRTADNIDLHHDGYIQRRDGFAPAKTGKWRDLWADELGAYAVVDGQLCSLDMQTLEPTPVVSAVPQGRMSYCRLPDGMVYASDGYSLWVLSGIVASNLPAPEPDLNPDIDAPQWVNMPAGSCLAHYRGQLLVASGSFLFISEPYRYNLHKPHRGFIPFPAPITVVAPCEDGVYVCADKTYWLGGDLFDGAIVTLAQFGALKNSLVLDNGRALAYWQSHKGLVIGGAGGQIKFPQDDAMDFETAFAGATWLREREGQKYLVATRLKEE